MTVNGVSGLSEQARWDLCVLYLAQSCFRSPQPDTEDLDDLLRDLGVRLEQLESAVLQTMRAVAGKG